VLWAAGLPRRPARIPRHSRLFVAGTVSCAAILGASALLPADQRVWIWGLLDIAYLIGLAATILAATPDTANMLTVTDALIGRFGLLIISCSGRPSPAS